jgi:hypothetical protein
MMTRSTSGGKPSFNELRACFLSPERSLAWLGGPLKKSSPPRPPAAVEQV